MRTFTSRAFSRIAIPLMVIFTPASAFAACQDDTYDYAETLQDLVSIQGIKKARPINDANINFLDAGNHNSAVKSYTRDVGNTLEKAVTKIIDDVTESALKAREGREPTWPEYESALEAFLCSIAVLEQKKASDYLTSEEKEKEEQLYEGLLGFLNDSVITATDFRNRITWMEDAIAGKRLPETTSYGSNIVTPKNILTALGERLIRDSDNKKDADRRAGAIEYFHSLLIDGHANYTETAGYADVDDFKHPFEILPKYLEAGKYACTEESFSQAIDILNMDDNYFNREIRNFMDYLRCTFLHDGPPQASIEKTYALLDRKLDNPATFEKAAEAHTELAKDEALYGDLILQNFSDKLAELNKAGDDESVQKQIGTIHKALKYITAYYLREETDLALPYVEVMNDLYTGAKTIPLSPAQVQDLADALDKYAADKDSEGQPVPDIARYLRVTLITHGASSEPAARYGGENYYQTMLEIPGNTGPN